MSNNDSWVTMSHFGKASAHLHRFADGEQTIIVNFGREVSVHMPYSQAVALRADLDDALALLISETGSAAA